VFYENYAGSIVDWYASTLFRREPLILAEGDDKRAHSSVTPGGAAVKDASGKFIHEDVWRYLFNQPVEKTGQPVPADPNCLKDLSNTAKPKKK